MQYAEIQKDTLKAFLQSALVNDRAVAAINKLDTIIADLADAVTTVPLVYMGLLYKAVYETGAKPEEVDVIVGIGSYGQYLAVTAQGIRLGEVRFVIDCANGYEMNAYLHLTPEALALIERKKSEPSD